MAEDSNRGGATTGRATRQAGTVSGRVVDVKGRPVSGAKVWVAVAEGSNLADYTDSGKDIGDGNPPAGPETDVALVGEGGATTTGGDGQQSETAPPPVEADDEGRFEVRVGDVHPFDIDVSDDWNFVREIWVMAEREGPSSVGGGDGGHWFGAAKRGDSSTVRITMNRELLFRAEVTKGKPQPWCRTTIWRRIEPTEEQPGDAGQLKFPKQALLTCVRDRQLPDEGPVVWGNNSEPHNDWTNDRKFLQKGVLTTQVEEAVDVDYPDLEKFRKPSETPLEIKEAKGPEVSMSIGHAIARNGKWFPVYAVMGGAEGPFFQDYVPKPDSGSKSGLLDDSLDVLKSILGYYSASASVFMMAKSGLVALVGGLSVAGGDGGDGDVVTVRLGNRSSLEPDLNRHDLFPQPWKKPGYAYVNRTRLGFPDGVPRSFAVRGQWLLADTAAGGGEIVNLDHGFFVDPRITSPIVPARAKVGESP